MSPSAKEITIIRALLLVVSALIAQACVTSPYNGQLVPDPSAPVTIAGFSHQPNVPLTIEASNPITGAWEVLGTTTSAATPTLAAGTWQNSPPLYFYSTTVQVSDPAHPQTLQRWGSFADDGFATLRVRSGDFNLYTGEEHSPDCVSQQASQTGDFYTTAVNCGYQQNTVWIYYKATGLARYNEVFQTATHNSYWVKRDNVLEAYVSGVQERLIDQLAFEHVRTLELDIHKAGTGDWEVYHNEPGKPGGFTSNSLCARLEDCLRHLELFHSALPRHEVVTVVLELKDFDTANFDDAHTIADLDAILEHRLGPSLFRPRDMFARCPPTTATLRECVRLMGWPTVSDLRGKFLFVVLGNWRDHCDGCNYYGQGSIGWVRYATEGGGVRDRSAFPMASDFAQIQESDAGYGAQAYDAFVTVPPGTLARACAASVFLQVETDLDHVWHCSQPDKTRALLAAGMVVRAGGRDAEAFDPVHQGQRAAAGIQLLQTDHPWHVFDDRGPMQPFRVVPTAGFPAGTTLIEPGVRTLFTSTIRGPQTRVFTYTDAADGDWTTLVAVTRPPTNDAYDNPASPRGVGCLRAQAGSRAPGDNTADHMAVCRLTRSGSVLGVPGENARIIVETAVRGQWQPQTFDAGANASNGIGELLRLSIHGKCATAQAASEAPNGMPAWTTLVTRCFDEPLTRQGLTADTGDVLFAGTRYTDAVGRASPVRTTRLSTPVLLGTFGQVLQHGVPGTQAYRVDDLSPAITTKAERPPPL